MAASFAGMKPPSPPVVIASAIMPGRITRNGKNIFGSAAMSGKVVALALYREALKLKPDYWNAWTNW